MRLFRALTKLRHRDRVEAELDSELRGYVEMLSEQYERAGMSPAAARRAALMDAGGVEQVKEKVRDASALAWAGSLWQDVRYALRGLRKTPSFTGVAVLSLALGIGANSAIFGVFYAVQVRPLPYPEAGRLVAVGRVDPGQTGATVVTPEFVAWRLDQHVFTGLTSWNDEQFNLTGAAMPERVVGASVSDDFLTVLGVHPSAGRDFAASDGRAALITHELSERQFGSEAVAVGRPVMLNGAQYTVAGVLPRGFRFPGEIAAEVLVPALLSKQPDFHARTVGGLRGIGRLRRGATLAQAAAEMAAISARYEPEMPEFLKQLRENTRVSAVPLQQELVGDTRPVLLALLGAVGLLLAIACVNVANLQLARATVRRREIGLRAALGASRGRLARLLVVENLVLATCAGVAGLAVASLLLQLLPLSAGLRRAAGEEVQVGWMLGAAAFGFSTIAGLLVGLAPAFLAPRLDLHEVLKSGAMSLTGGRRIWLRPALVVSQVALALVLLLGSGLLLRSLQSVLAVDLGFRSDRTVMAGMRLAGPQYKGDEAKAAFLASVLERVSALPGVESAAFANSPPMAGYSLMAAVTAEGGHSAGPGGGINVPVVVASPEYFRVLGIRLLRGRLFTDADRAGGPEVLVVSAQFAKRVFHTDDPIGKRVKYLGSTGTIAGMVSDVRHGGRERGASAELIVPEWQHPSAAATLLVRTKRDPASVAAVIRPAVWSVDKDMPVFDLSTMEDRLAKTGATRQTQTVLLTTFGLLALLLSAVGIYGVASEAVSQRAREIGLRMALGAQSAEVVGMIMRRSCVLAVAGIGIGCGAGMWLSRYLATLLFRVKPTDAATFAGAALVLLVVALIAGYVPARRAARIDPVAALRCE